MSYVVNKTNGNIVAIVEDGTIDTTSTTLSLVGRGVNSYGELMAENMIKILEHSSNPVQPPYAIAGQLWWDSSAGVMRAFDGAVWTSPVATTYYSTTTNTSGTASITVVNDSGVTVGDNAKATLGVTAGLVSLRVGALSPTLTALTIDPGTGRVQTPHVPAGTTDLVNKAYADALPQISTGTTSAAVTSTDFTLTVDGTTRIVVDSTALTITGEARADTPASNADDTQIATTAFVQAQKIDPIFTGTPTAPTATSADNSTQLATTSFVQANKISPAFMGTPTAPTAAPGTNTDQLATTAFITTAVGLVGGGLFAPITNAALQGTPTAPTAPPLTVTDQIATTAYVQQTFGDFVNAPYAPKLSPQLTGIPTTPTAAQGSNSTQISSTAFVQTAISANLINYLPKINPSMLGIPTAPTANLNLSNTQVANTEFVSQKAQILIDAALLAYQNLIITYGTTQVNSFTNVVGQFRNEANFFDIFPPSGKNMGNLAGFLPSIAYIYYAGGVNGDDNLRCVWSNLGDRIRVYVQNSEQRSFPAANWIAFWR